MIDAVRTFLHAFIHGVPDDATTRALIATCEAALELAHTDEARSGANFAFNPLFRDALVSFRHWWRGEQGITLNDVRQSMVTAWNAFSAEVRAGYRGREPLFAGDVYVPARDDDRLLRQLGRICGIMADGQWHTKPELVAACGDLDGSIGAQLGHLRKPKHGTWIVEKSQRDDRHPNLWSYRMRNPDGTEGPPWRPYPPRVEL